MKESMIKLLKRHSSLKCQQFTYVKYIRGSMILFRPIQLHVNVIPPSNT